ncbi:hypothetical protein [Herbaspirillum sp. YR522]|uniref:hypothetical protein n=1 Tax=Herbaspirillum sp. YR522 TaxID=1144342 RepID=UPI00026F5CC1|nr:hypothetical protein [Herbaspirillum sp. YR522]EJN01750.1 hypothetical protein PMI40_03237 [Herbaspirillum sp. YR522]
MSFATLPHSHAASPSRRYVIRTLAFMAVYAVLNLGAILGVFDTWIGTPAGWGLALAVALPVAGQVWSLWRLIVESDEYLRALWAKRVILSAGIVMVVSSAWGFGESYAAAPSLNALLIYPLFWMVSAVVWPLVRSSR